MKLLLSLFAFYLVPLCAQSQQDSTRVRIAPAAGKVYFLDCENGFGGGNVAASIGEDGILLVDDMFASMTARLDAALKTISAKPVRMVINTHFHGDHIQGNINYHDRAVIIAHENVRKRLLAKDKQDARMLPAVLFTDSLTITFNGEQIRILHFADSHTDGDAAVYFTQSKVLHLGDMFFFGMFPAVYTEGGGNILQLIVSLDKILGLFPADSKVIAGHGNLATMQDLRAYVAMLKETTGIVAANIKKGISLEQMIKEKLFAKYDALGSGGAQTTEEYLTMVYKLLKEAN